MIRTIQGGQLGRIAVIFMEWAGVYFQSPPAGWIEISGTFPAPKRLYFATA